MPASKKMKRKPTSKSKSKAAKSSPRKVKLPARSAKARSKLKTRTKAKAHRPTKKRVMPRTTPLHPELNNQIPQYDDRPEAFTLETAEGTDALAEELGEEFIENVTGADDAASDHHDAVMTEENGGPFVATSSRTELADDVDESNPIDAMREPLPLSASAQK
jgi:hypothetical protein